MPRPVRPIENLDRLVYSEYHFSPFLLVFFLLGEAAMLSSSYFYGATAVMAGTSLALLIGWLLFYSLRVAVDHDSLYLVYGIGLIMRSLDLAAVESVMVKEDRFLSSWLYRPFGGYAVLLFLRDGGRWIVPAENPRELSRVLNVKR